MNWNQPKVYAVRHKDEQVRMRSRSGGIFSALSDRVLSDGGVVYGCVLTEDFRAVHVRAQTMAQRDRMRGSKYIQSDLGTVFREVAEDLKEGRTVLFSGTSCQVAGLRSYLNKPYETLLCVDIVCHGVPSPQVWQDYLAWQTKKHGQITAVDFRNKQDFGWTAHVETLTAGDGKKVNSRVFTNLFYGHSILRPSCYRCPYKDVLHPGDITIADYWGIEQAAPEFHDDRGVSLVLVNNDVGAAAFGAVEERVRWKATRLEDSIQPPLRAPFEAPAERTKFWQDYRSMSFGKIAAKYADENWQSKTKAFIRRVKHAVKKRLMPHA